MRNRQVQMAGTSSLEPAREQRLKMRLGVFPGDSSDFDLGQAGFFQEAMQRALLETEPNIGVKLASPGKRVLIEIEHEELAAGAEDAGGLVDCVLRMLRVVQRLAQDSEIDGRVRKGDLLNVAELIGKIEQAVFLREVDADLDHARRIVDAPDLSGAVGQELGNK